MSSSLKVKAIKGIGWSAVERFSVQTVSFFVQIILARILTPEDFGIIGMLVVFIQIAQVFIDSGFANALIKKQDCTEADFSTVFYYNLFVSVLIYCLFYFGAPFLSVFYNEVMLVPVLRILSLILIINALCIVQKTVLVKNIDFKTQSKVTLLSSCFSGALGIYMAYKGKGVWALVMQQLANSLIQFILYLFYVKWIPTLFFSKTSFCFVFNYGSKLLFSSLISVLYQNLYTIVIGKKFTSYELGIYTRADGFARFPSSNLSNIISRAAFPVLSKVQDDDIKLVACYKKLIIYSSFIIFPLMCGLIAVAKPFILFVLTNKWIETVCLLQILCITWAFDHLCSLNLNLLYVKGRTDLVLKLEVYKKIIAIIILLLSIPLGLKGMCWGLVLYTIFAVFINTFYTNRLFKYGWKEQFRDYLPYLLASIFMMSIVYVTISFLNSPILRLTVGISVGVIIYTAISCFFFGDIIHEVKILFKNMKLVLLL